MFRHKFTLVLFLSVFHIACCQADAAEPPAQWWKTMGSVRRFLPEENVSAAQIISQLDTLKAAGYNVIEITAPYDSAATWPWWGLRPLNYFAVNRVLGTDINGFKNLVTQCHNRGMACMTDINFGFDDIGSSTWAQAQQDKKNGITNGVASYYNWADNTSASLGNPPNAFFAQQGITYLKGDWVYSSTAGKYYWSSWQWKTDGLNLYEPQYNWGGTSWPAQAKKIANFWMSTGIDGIIVDAPQWYINCTFPLLKSTLVDVIHSYGANKMALAEGTGILKEDYVQWITQGGFDLVDDQFFETDSSNGTPPTLQAILTQNPSALESVLQSRHDKVLAAGGVLWSYPGWDNDLTKWTAERRLIGIATLVGTGRLLDISPEYFTSFSAAQLTARDAIMRAGQSYPALAPAGARSKLATNNDNMFYAFLKTYAGKSVLAVYNFQQNSSQTITINLSGSGITVPQKPVDCINGGYGPNINSNSYTITLGPLGYTFLSVTGTGAAATPNVLLSGVESRSRPGNAAGSILTGLYVVTWDGTKAAQDWYAVTLSAPTTINQIVFTHGKRFADGGWFDTSAGKPQVQVQTSQNGAWTTVGELSAYPATTAADAGTLADGAAFTCQLSQSVQVWGVRVTGKPASGTNPQQAYSSCAGLAAYLLGAGQTVPGKIEAENYTAMAGVQTEPTADTGGGQNVGYIGAGDWLEYTINVPTAGVYRLDLRVAGVGGTGGRLTVRPGTASPVTVTLPVTGGWQTWTTVSTSVTLNAGVQTLRLDVGTGGFNLNWLQFGASSSYTTWLPQAFTPEEIANPAISGDTADPDGDGISNFLEYKLGGDPKVNHPITGKLEPLTVNGAARIHYEINFKEGRDDVLIVPEVTTDLKTWSATDPGLVQTVASNHDGTALLAVDYPAPAVGGVFIRLRAARSL